MWSTNALCNMTIHIEPGRSCLNGFIIHIIDAIYLDQNFVLLLSILGKQNKIRINTD